MVVLSEHKKYPDHHNFSAQEIAELKEENCIITTEKDFMRLAPFIDPKKLFYQPITIDFLEKKEDFDADLRQFVMQY